MRISKITIKQLFGIKEWQGDGKNIELVGDNGTGKTSVIRQGLKGTENPRSTSDYGKP